MHLNLNFNLAFKIVLCTIKYFKGFVIEHESLKSARFSVSEQQRSLKLFKQSHIIAQAFADLSPFHYVCIVPMCQCLHAPILYKRKQSDVVVKISEL